VSVESDFGYSGLSPIVFNYRREVEQVASSKEAGTKHLFSLSYLSCRCTVSFSAKFVASSVMRSFQKSIETRKCSPNSLLRSGEQRQLLLSS
jgi:hypothetical protein